MKDLASIEIDENCFIREVFVSDGRLVILYTESKCEEGKKAEDGIYKDYTCAAVYDVTDPANPREAGVISQSGQYHTMRVKDGYVYLVSDFTHIMIRRYQTKAIISRRSREVCSARKIYICRRNDRKSAHGYFCICAFRPD